jgi:hypothetical protein
MFVTCNIININLMPLFWLSSEIICGNYDNLCYICIKVFTIFEFSNLEHNCITLGYVWTEDFGGEGRTYFSFLN